MRNTTEKSKLWKVPVPTSRKEMAVFHVDVTKRHQDSHETYRMHPCEGFHTKPSLISQHCSFWDISKQTQNTASVILRMCPLHKRWHLKSGKTVLLYLLFKFKSLKFANAPRNEIGLEFSQSILPPPFLAEFSACFTKSFHLITNSFMDCLPGCSGLSGN